MNIVSRRSALKSVGICGAAIAIPRQLFGNYSGALNTIRFGVIADLHGGLAKDAESRLDSFLEAMNENELDALVQLGDFAYPNQKHQQYADKLNKAHKNTIHVIGNHEFDHGLDREDCYRAWGISKSYFRQDVSGIRLLVLDGNDKGSPNYKGGYPSYIGEKQQAWLADELEASDKPILILSHQPLAGRGAIDNAKDIQKLLSRFKQKIILCLNGHTHIDAQLDVDGVQYLHINSASYFWVGGKERMLYYRDPLYTTLTIDPNKSLITVKAKASEWKTKSPDDIGFFERQNAPSKKVVVPQIRQRVIERAKLKIRN